MKYKQLTKSEEAICREAAEKAVKIPVGGRLGRWTREDRVALVYSVLCSLCRMKKNA